VIVVFSHAHPSVSKGGAEISAYTLYQGLRQSGVAAAFVAMVPHDQMDRVRMHTPDEHLLPYRPEAYDHFFHLADPGVLAMAREVLDALRPQALVFHHFLFLGINTVRDLAADAAAAGVPSVLVLHEFLALCHHHGQMVTRPAKRLCERGSPSRCSGCFPEHGPDEFAARRRLFQGAFDPLHRLVSPSHFLAGRFADWGVPPQRLAVIENGLAGWNPATPDEPPPVRTRDQPTVFGYFGQINPFKGVDQILEAVALLRQRHPDLADLLRVRVHGNLVGLTDEFRAQFDAATAPGGAVEYHGPYQNVDVHRLMVDCDYVLLASTWWENSPVVIQEAWAARRPVIVPGLGGMAEKVVHQASGYHFRPNDPRDLAARLLACSQTDLASALTLPRPLSAREMAAAYLDLGLPRAAR
jgi:glycosyltransferase involved in cell wall biosynthesis